MKSIQAFRRTQQCSLIVLLFTSLMMSTNLLAAVPPLEGVIMMVDARQQSIVIDGNRYMVTTQTSIYSGDQNREIQLDDLTPGQTVSFDAHEGVLQWLHVHEDAPSR